MPIYQGGCDNLKWNLGFVTLLHEAVQAPVAYRQPNKRTNLLRETIPPNLYKATSHPLYFNPTITKMARYTNSPYNKTTSGHSPQAIWQKFRAISVFNAERGETDSIVNLIRNEKAVAVKKPRAVRTGGNPDMCFGSCCRG
ncbi:hypothetical protein V495_05249 [Pseudogymnoascus sp. VKM F-4514 (FW-929)]|nr:hypothetical protein V495_05249 [Pseudogymnoascus sp. VKM F-4514 (FW-929)]KFY60553.1 hypothetical protein V497_03556 [Pseudogymnoascus sp. VKM F-4516 (FW-969)]